MIDIRCSSCEGEYQVADGYAGQRIKCRRCGVVLVVPENGGGPCGSTVTEPAAERSGRGRPAIRFRCTKCYQKHGVPEESAGKRIRCTNCGEILTAPALATGTTVWGLDHESDGLDGPEDAEPVPTLPSMEEYHNRLKAQRVIRRTVRTAAASLVLFVAVLFGYSGISGWIEDGRAAALDEQVTAMISQTEEAVADLDFEGAHATLDGAWAAVEGAGVAPHKTRDLRDRLRRAVVDVSSAEKNFVRAADQLVRESGGELASEE